MKRTCLAGLLMLTVLQGCGGTTPGRSVYAAHCYQFRARHLLIFHKTYVLKFYQPSSFYRYLHTHPRVQYRRVRCSLFGG